MLAKVQFKNGSSKFFTFHFSLFTIFLLPLQAVIIHQQQKAMAKQKKFILQESEIPTQWYNIQADMPNKPLPPIHPATKQPLGVDDLAHIFPRECCVQELDTEHRWIDIPEDVLEKYKYYR